MNMGLAHEGSPQTSDSAWGQHNPAQAQLWALAGVVFSHPSGRADDSPCRSISFTSFLQAYPDCP